MNNIMKYREEALTFHYMHKTRVVQFNHLSPIAFQSEHSLFVYTLNIEHEIYFLYHKSRYYKKKNVISKEV